MTWLPSPSKSLKGVFLFWSPLNMNRYFVLERNVIYTIHPAVMLHQQQQQSHYQQLKLQQQSHHHHHGQSQSSSSAPPPPPPPSMPKIIELLSLFSHVDKKETYRIKSRLNVFVPEQIATSNNLQDIENNWDHLESELYPALKKMESSTDKQQALVAYLKRKQHFKNFIPQPSSTSTSSS
ncbi:hypothetical protein DFA_00062 [Cavenderia fasciculata]|uniref:Uncharacterized protein n=1 Tax=Cavenderia fasciculata TaxID=261658 RepID=F4PXH5_CACFS|nr:uncharacterized protein DFA_00062 [Cavenderia fasciculata]EGG19485.1 hypothetical protein DFA_00062 [Cavenderia fasciculata]|eukprot:XP_004357779.1 hypothetical protein DFA_00062 [Cavenderia fasciculata]